MHLDTFKIARSALVDIADVLKVLLGIEKQSFTIFLENNSSDNRKKDPH